MRRIPVRHSDQIRVDAGTGSGALRNYCVREVRYIRRGEKEVP
jgi:hypothetical protein